MSQVQAGYFHSAQIVTSDGNDTLVSFDGHGTVLDVRAFSKLSVAVEPGAAGCDFTVTGYATRELTGEALAIKAKTTASADTFAFVDKYDLMGCPFVTIKEDGTLDEVQKVIVTCK